MPLYDFECKHCKRVTEEFATPNINHIRCPWCGEKARKIISMSGVHTSNDDAKWIRSVVDVVDKKSKKPHDMEFIKNPTRRNLKAWMDGNNLRHIEPGEKATEPWKPDAGFKGKLARRYQERNRVEI
jgi:putative FmdB family regulatory protein